MLEKTLRAREDTARALGSEDREDWVQEIMFEAI